MFDVERLLRGGIDFSDGWGVREYDRVITVRVGADFRNNVDFVIGRRITARVFAFLEIDNEEFIKI